MASSGPNNPGTIVSSSAVGTRDWANPGNAATSNNVWAVSAGVAGSETVSYYLKATNFGFAIPAGSTINGILVGVERYKGVILPTLKDNILKLVIGGTVTGNDKADTATDWPTSEAYKSYGGAADLWGLTPTVAQINGSDFGMVISVTLGTAPKKGAQDASIDHIRITVYYTEAAGGPVIPVFMNQYRQRSN